MSEDESRRVDANEEQGDEVEAHRHPHTGMTEEATDGPTEGDDDFEAHRHSLKARPGEKG